MLHCREASSAVYEKGRRVTTLLFDRSHSFSDPAIALVFRTIQKRHNILSRRVKRFRNVQNGRDLAERETDTKYS